jgi:hypothetical protein
MGEIDATGIAGAVAAAIVVAVAVRLAVVAGVVAAVGSAGNPVAVDIDSAPVAVAMVLEKRKSDIVTHHPAASRFGVTSRHMAADLCIHSRHMLKDGKLMPVRE